METAGHSGPFALDTIPDADRLAADPLACPPADLSLETTCRCSYEPTTGSASSTSCVHQKRENVNYESQGSINNHYCSSTDYDMQSFPIQLASSPYPKSLEISSNPVFATSCQTWQDSMPIQTDGRYPPRSLWLENICQNLVRDMQNHGLCVIDNFLESFGSRRDLILEEVNLLYDSDMFKEGRLVNNKLKGIPIRNDKIVWVSGQEELCSQIGFLVRLVDTIIVNCSALAFENVVKNCNIQTRTKAMIACYPGDGARYVKHVDNPNEDGRCITCIYYLNRDWDVQVGSFFMFNSN